MITCCACKLAKTSIMKPMLTGNINIISRQIIIGIVNVVNNTKTYRCRLHLSPGYAVSKLPSHVLRSTLEVLSLLEKEAETSSLRTPEELM